MSWNNPSEFRTSSSLPPLPSSCHNSLQLTHVELPEAWEQQRQLFNLVGSCRDDYIVDMLRRRRRRRKWGCDIWREGAKGTQYVGLKFQNMWELNCNSSSSQCSWLHFVACLQGFLEEFFKHYNTLIFEHIFRKNYVFSLDHVWHTY